MNDFKFKPEDFKSTAIDEMSHKYFNEHCCPTIVEQANAKLKEWLGSMPTMKYLGYGEWQPEYCDGPTPEAEPGVSKAKIILIS